jgi:hypothetical protein
MRLLVIGTVELPPRRPSVVERARRGVAVWVRSLRAHAPEARVVMLNGSPEDAALRALCDAHGVESVDLRALEAEHAWPPMDLNNRRFLACQLWAGARAAADRVLVTDTFDVVWQAPPSGVVEADPRFTVWQENQIIAACRFNAKWVAETFPADAARLLPRPVICAGVLGGTPDAMLAYLDHFHGTARAKAPVRHGFDQAFPTWYAYTYPDGVRVVPYPNAEVAHLGYADPATVRWEDGAVWLGERRPAIVHQYNRHPAVEAALSAAWGG